MIADKVIGPLTENPELKFVFELFQKFSRMRFRVVGLDDELLVPAQKVDRVGELPLRRPGADGCEDRSQRCVLQLFRLKSNDN